MDVDLFLEIKELQTCMMKKLFSMSKKKCSGGPKPIQFAILGFLLSNRDKDIYQKDLENKFNISKAAISSVLNTMEKGNLICRIQSDSDARRNKIVVTEYALSMHDEFINDTVLLHEKMLNGISKDEIAIFLELINKMKNNMKEEG